MHTWKCKQKKIATTGFRATGLYPVNRNIFEDFDFDAATEEHNPCAGALLSRKESATRSHFVLSVLKSQVVLPSRRLHILLLPLQKFT
jgi:hypothetical protein